MTTEVAPSWTETAYDWFQRSKRKREEIPKDPSSSAWSFFRSGSGISFMDAAFRRHTPTLPVIHLTGDVAKTWTLLSLAARFVVQTRPSQFTTTTADVLPQVLWLDSHQQVTASKLAHVVRSTLLRHIQTAMADAHDEQLFNQDLQDCCERIHLARAATDWVPLLECWRHQLAAFDSHPTLIVWDGFLEDDDDVTRTEIVRQLSRLLEQCSVVLVTASSSPRNLEWDRFITQRVRLQRNAVTGGHEYLATVQASQIPFSISASGILS